MFLYVIKGMILKRLLKFSKWFFSILVGICILFSAAIYIFEDQIVESILEEVNSNLKTPIKSEEVEVTFWSSFPDLQVHLKKVHIEGIKGSEENDLLYSDNIRLAFSPFDFMDGIYKVKTVDIEPGELNLRVDSVGNVNYDILHESDSEGDFMVELKKISFRNFTVNYANKATKQSISTKLQDVVFSGDLSSEKFDLKTAGNFYLNAFSSNGVNLITNKNIQCSIDLSVDHVNDEFTLRPSVLNIENLPFHCRGKVQKDSLDFTIDSKDILISEMVKTLLPKEKMDLSHLKGEGNVDFNVHFFGKTGVENPALIACRFHVEDGSILEPYKGTAIKNIQLSGEYTNVGGESEEKIELNTFSCKTVSGPFQGNFTFKNFKRPRLFGKVKGKLDLQMIQNLFRLKGIQHLKGLMSVNSSFDFSQKNHSEDFDIKSFKSLLDVKNGHISLIGDIRVVEQFNGKLNFNGKDLRFDNVKFRIGKNDLQLHGTLKEFIKNMRGTEELHPELNVKSAYLNVDELLDDGSNTSDEDESYTLPDFLFGNISLSVEQLIYDQKRYSNFTGKAHFDKHKIELEKCNFSHSNSIWNGDIRIAENTLGRIEIGGNISTSGTDMKKLFEDWDNLGQDALKSDNIASGKADIALKFNFPYLVKSEDFDYDNIEAVIDLRIPEITLKNVELFRDMTESLKENASKMVLGLNNIQELDKKLRHLTIYGFKNTVTIAHGNIILPKMDIHSNAMDIELTAVHGFNDIVDYRLVIPYRSLRSSVKQTKFGIIEQEGDGISLFLKVFGDLDDLQFEWDKNRHKKQLSENLIKEKNQIKSMLKTEFGLYSKNEEIKKMEKKEPEKKGEVRLHFKDKKDNSSENSTTNETNEKEGTKKRKGLLRKTINAWKESSTNNEPHQPVIKIN